MKENKRFQRNRSCIFDYDSKKLTLHNLGGQGNWIWWRVWIFRKAEGMQIYSALSETEDAFAERITRFLAIVLYRYIEDCGYKYFHKLSKFVTTLNSRRNCTIDLILKNVVISGFFSIIYIKPVREYQKPKFRIGDWVRISKFDLPCKKGI